MKNNLKEDFRLVSNLFARINKSIRFQGLDVIVISIFDDEEENTSGSNNFNKTFQSLKKNYYNNNKLPRYK